MGITNKHKFYLGPNYGGKKRFGFGLKPRGDTTQHFCEICKISCAGAQTFKEHQEGLILCSNDRKT